MKLNVKDERTTANKEMCSTVGITHDSIISKFSKRVSEGWRDGG